jgi:hypothetical protein
MTVDQYLFHLHATRLLLMAGCAGQGDRRGQRLAEQWRDHRVCCSPPNHQKEWYHAGYQRYVCAICERIAV